MTWREELRKVQITADGRPRTFVGGSFRGVPFFVEDFTQSGGRAVVVHEFPYRDEPEITDLGRQARRHTVEAYTIGDDCLVQRDALRDAVEAEGRGVLVHPEFRNDLVAQCTGYSIRASRDRAGIVSISLSFVEISTRPPVRDETDLAGLALESVTVADAASETQLVSAYDTSDAPGYATVSLEADAVAVADAVESSFLSLDLTAQERAALVAAVSDIRSDILTLARSPAALLAAFRGLLDAVPTLLATAPREALAALLRVHDTPLQPVALGTTPARDVERANQVELAGALRRWAVLAAAELSIGVTYATTDEALADRSALLSRIDAQLTTTGDDAYQAMVDMRAAVASAIPGNRTLARALTVSVPTSTSAILLSQQLYGTPEREAEIVARNRSSQHPGFIVGAVSVLSEVP